MANKKTAIVLSGGGMRCCYSAGFMYGLSEQKLSSDILVCGSASSGTGAYFSSGQYESIREIWTKLLSTEELIEKKFNNLLPMHRPLLDVDYLIDGVLKGKKVNNNVLDAERLKNSEIDFYVATTNSQTGKVEYFSNRHEDLDIFEVLRASKAIPLVYGKKIKLNGAEYHDFRFSSDGIHSASKAIELGAEKILLVNTSSEKWKDHRITDSIVIFTKNWEFKKNHILNLRKTINFQFSKDIEHLVLKPGETFKMNRLDNSQEALETGFEKGRIASYSPDVAEFLINRRMYFF